MNKSRLLTIACALATTPLLFAQPAKSPPVEFQTTLWASSCMTCHGTDGKAEGVGMTINGRKYEDLYTTLIAYKAGQRTGTVMHHIVRGYSDDQLKQIAQYFSQLK
ncbi:MAG: hypothetical protein WBK51_17470 [Polaromonas sp.]